MKSFVISKNGWTGGQYSFYRILFGIYLTVHFLHLLPWASEIFSAQGMIPLISSSPTINYFPNIFLVSDCAIFVEFMVVLSAISSVLFTLGYKDKIAAIFIWFMLACLFSRNPLIANPSLPYTGWLLLAHCFIPKEPYGSFTARFRENPKGTWFMPQEIFIAAWLVLALSYSYSGYTKMLSPSWMAGHNIMYVLQNPLARDYFLRDFLLWLPPIFLQILTWTVLYIELLFAPLALIKKMRPILWGVMFFIQCGFAFLLNFFDLTAAMLLFHMLTFNPSWVKPKLLAKNSVLFYDGGCSLCHGFVRFMLAEDTHNQLTFSSLQGNLFKNVLSQKTLRKLPDSIVLVEGEQIFIKSDAVMRLLKSLGGFWKVLGLILCIIPKPIRNCGYTLIGNIRYKVFGGTITECPLIPENMRSKFQA